MKDTKIKICGVNDIDIAKYIYNINLDYLGLVFCTNSVRNIEIDIAKDICSLEKKKQKMWHFSWIVKKTSLKIL